MDFLALDADFDAQRGADVGALNDRAPNPDITGKIGGAERIVERATAGIANERMSGSAKVVIGAKFVEIGDVFKFAVAVGALREKAQ